MNGLANASNIDRTILVTSYQKVVEAVPGRKTWYVVVSETFLSHNKSNILVEAGLRLRPTSKERELDHAPRPSYPRVPTAAPVINKRQMLNPDG